MIVKVCLSIGISLLILGVANQLVFHSSSQRLLPQVLAVLKQCSWLLVCTYTLSALVQSVLRAFRYKLLIAAGGIDRPPGLAQMTLVTMVRNMTVDMLPARLGELGYVAMLNRGYHVTGGSCVSSLVVSTVFDMLSLLVFLLGLAVGQLLFRQSGAGSHWVLALLAAGALVLTAVVFKGIPLLSVWLKRWRYVHEKHLAQWLMAFLENVANAVKNTSRAGILVLTLLLSVAIRLVKYGALYMLLYSLAGAADLDPASLAPASILSGLVSAEAAASIPVPTFLGFGTYETGAVVAFGVIGIDKAKALLLFLSLHIFTQTIDYLLGGLAFLLFVFRLPDAKRIVDTSSTQTKKSATIWLTAMTTASALAGIVFFSYQVHKTRKLGSLQAPAVGEPVSHRNISENLSKLSERLKGFIVWSSNRFGNHDILMVTLPEMRLRRLTRHPHTEYFPRISPDGRKIAFCRSQIPWVSQRNDKLWDVIVMDLESGEEKMVAKNGNAPSWSEDGARMYFQRNGNQFISLDLQTGNETLIYQTGNQYLPDTVRLEAPVYSSAKKSIAATLRGSKRAVVTIADHAEPRYLGQGCQINWGPGATYLYQVDKGGRLINAVYKILPDAGYKRVLWLDLPGEFSHEYFPKIGNLGRYMVLGASAGGHEHDSADYEIFIWRIGSQPEKAVRLTYHTGNDCWPDIYLTSAN